MEYLQQSLFWAFVPGSAASFLQRQYYSFVYRGTPPQPHEPKYRLHWNRIFTTIVLGYLFYTLVQVERSFPPNFYQHLNLDRRTFNSKDLRGNYRALSLMYHPDKAQNQGDPTSELRYLTIRKAYETLKDPVYRAAYERFGEDVLRCTHCKTDRDFLMFNVMSVGVFYTTTALLLGVLFVLGKGEFGSFWRAIALLLLCSLELRMIFNAPTVLLSDEDASASLGLAPKPRVWEYVFAWRTTHEKVVMLRQLFIVVCIAVSQVGPILFPDKKQGLNRQIAELEMLTELQMRESAVVHQAAFLPFRDDPKAVYVLQRKMEKLAVDLRLGDAEPALMVGGRRVAGKKNN
ncbi:hypothetical protein BJ742DRAFT_807558 [Cladochytrium replicatum]|nr:hypothetical protein BJ742DRAFT_807558 [Cladochytrium replicatum]